MFFTISQNNSGGYFLEDNKAGVCEYVIIEADTAEEAKDKLKKIGESVTDFYEFCPCCGERWDTFLMNDDDGQEVPCIGITPISEVKESIFTRRCFTHYKDGRVEETIFKEKR